MLGQEPPPISQKVTDLGDRGFSLCKFSADSVRTLCEFLGYLHLKYTALFKILLSNRDPHSV